MARAHRHRFDFVPDDPKDPLRQALGYRRCAFCGMARVVAVVRKNDIEASPLRSFFLYRVHAGQTWSSHYDRDCRR